MARIQRHHLIYKPKEWILPANMLAHRTVSRVQQTRATTQAYADLTAFIHAMMFEWNRMRMELDTGVDCRVIDFTRAKLEKRPKVTTRQATEALQQIRKTAGIDGDPLTLLMELKVMVDATFKRKKKLKKRGVPDGKTKQAKKGGRYY
jgi:hypothetical protein